MNRPSPLPEMTAGKPPPNRSPLRVAARELGVELGGREILCEVSCTLPAGGLSVLLGPNGAGKSTFARVLTGVLTPDRGRVEIGGRALESFAPRELARTVAFIPQDTHIEFPFRVEELVAMGRYPHLRPLERERPADREAVRRALSRLELTGLGARAVTTLSAGELQRTLIARALATEAPVIVADEAISDLDIRHRLETIHLLRSLARDGYTVLAILHDIDLALRFADHVILLEKGRVVKEGPPQAFERGRELEEVFRVRIERRNGSLVFHLPPEAPPARRSAEPPPPPRPSEPAPPRRPPESQPPERPGASP